MAHTHTRQVRVAFFSIYNGHCDRSLRQRHKLTNSQTRRRTLTYSLTYSVTRSQSLILTTHRERERERERERKRIALVDLGAKDAPSAIHFSPSSSFLSVSNSNSWPSLWPSEPCDLRLRDALILPLVLTFHSFVFLSLPPCASSSLNVFSCVQEHLSHLLLLAFLWPFFISLLYWPFVWATRTSNPLTDSLFDLNLSRVCSASVCFWREWEIHFYFYGLSLPFAVAFFRLKLGLKKVPFKHRASLNDSKWVIHLAKCDLSFPSYHFLPHVSMYPADVCLFLPLLYIPLSVR